MEKSSKNLIYKKIKVHNKEFNKFDMHKSSTISYKILEIKIKNILIKQNTILISGRQYVFNVYYPEIDL